MATGSKAWQAPLAIALLGALLFIPFLGRVHLFDWDEINFAEAAREMIVLNDYLRVHIDYEPFWEKPPLFIWAQALCMHLFGINEFAARLPNALTGIATLVLLYSIGRRLADARLAMLWVAAYAGSFLPHFYFRSGIIDPLFNLTIFLGIYCLARYYLAPAGQRHIGWVALAGACVGLAVLTKGPVGYLLPVLSWAVAWGFSRHSWRFPWREGLLFTLCMLAVTSLWYGVDLIRNGPWFLTQFVQYQIRLLTTGDAGHSGPIYYHFVVVFLGCFPASLFALGAFKAAGNGSPADAFHRWMLILLAVVLVVFSLVKTKILHYSSLAYFPVTYLAAYALHAMLYGNKPWRPYLTYLLSFFGLLWGILLMLVPLVGLFAKHLLPYVREPFAHAALQADVHWSGAELLVGLVYAGLMVLVVYWVSKQQLLRAAYTAFGATALTLCTTLPFIVPKVEAYSQRAAIEYYESLQGCDCYLRTLDFKSYAQYFYGRLQPGNAPPALHMSEEAFTHWLLHGPIDKPAYFVVKVQDAPKYLSLPELTLLGQKNGFAFLRRMPAPQNLALQARGTRQNGPAPYVAKSVVRKP